MQLLDGNLCSEQIRQEITQKVDALKADGQRAPHLAAVLVGNDGYPARGELVRAMLVSVAGLAVDDRMPAKRDRHGELGLAWPDPDGKARLVRFRVGRRSRSDRIRTRTGCHVVKPLQPGRGAQGRLLTFPPSDGCTSFRYVEI